MTFEYLYTIITHAKVELFDTVLTTSIPGKIL
jgi:hypothetical protein